MARYVFRLPDVGEGIAEAEIVEWHVAVGDTVAEEQPLVDVMTDKATVELTSPVAGVVTGLTGEEGEDVAVGSDLVVFETDAEAPSEAAAAAPEAAPGSATVPEAAEPEESEDLPAYARPLASPATRRRAREQGIDLAAIKGSGPDGRILDADLKRPAAASPALATREGVEDVKVVGLRRRIAERLSQSKRRIPHFAYVEEVDVTELEALRTHLNATRAEGRPALSLPPFLIQALVRVLPDFPQINALFDDEAGVVHRHAAVHMGVAVQTRDGLMVPVVRNAEARDLWELSAEIARLAAAVRAGRATREELAGSTITLTSLGALGGVATTPIINAPEVAIIGPNRIVERPVVVGGQVVVRKMMNLSSSFDHRVVDGYDAAAFIQAVKAKLEHPALLFMPE
ncbi:MAG TPA: dihydrolipoamide acetyltransferase family protein [Caulobacteraceae bacterium]|jgi:2-oxoisovalerate dehydrogenase E2 component (dihydrolipoyl transacylase)|nr:dihydrolipoamide acetyltransferase family protein [Caulobacteraceae bacterium]